MKRVLLAMSGGVDSSACAILLKKQGYEVIGVTFDLLGSQSQKAIQDAKTLCNKLQIEHHVINLQETFKAQIIDYFVESYKNNETPNPCIKCNKKIKFGELYNQMKNYNCDYIATGHYAKREYDNNLQQDVIKSSRAKGKDQTYVLYDILPEIVSYIIFPLADFENKDQIRNIVSSESLDIANKKDSQEICFIPNNDYVSYIRQTTDYVLSKGKIVNKDGTVLGEHNGIINYTIGQRKGLRLTHKTPLYVIGLNQANNEVIVGEEADLYSNLLYFTDENFLVKDPHMESISQDMQHGWEEMLQDIEAKIRYSAKPAKARIDLKTKKVIFDEPQRAITPGQAVVFYKGDILLGGAKIIKTKN